MQYIHVKNLEKYHPGYKDRTLQWAKIYFKMVQGNPDCEMITNEIDWSRLVRLILLELQARRPIPCDNLYLTRKGLDLKKRFLSSTLDALKTFVVVLSEKEMEEYCNETVTKPLQNVHLDKDKEKDKDKEEDKERKTKKVTSPKDFLEEIHKNPAYAHIDIKKELGKMDAWLSAHKGRQKTKKFVVNWLNKIEVPLKQEKRSYVR